MPRSVPVLLGLHDTARSEVRMCRSGKGGPGASVSAHCDGQPKTFTALWHEHD